VSACARAAPGKVHVAARSTVVRGSAPSDTLERVVECSWKEGTQQNPELLPGEDDTSGGATVGRDSGNAAMSPARTQPVCSRSIACLWRNSKRPRRGPPATARTLGNAAQTLYSNQGAAMPSAARWLLVRPCRISSTAGCRSAERWGSLCSSPVRRWRACAVPRARGVCSRQRCPYRAPTNFHSFITWHSCVPPHNAWR
jgi:hypothetical protein